MKISELIIMTLLFTASNYKKDGTMFCIVPNIALSLFQKSGILSQC